MCSSDLGGLRPGEHQVSGLQRRPVVDLRLEHLPGGRVPRLLDDHARYAAARDEILWGNVPDFLRVLVPVTLHAAAHEVTVFVTPDYLAVGTDDDCVPIPLDFIDAAAVAARLGVALPTARIVDAVYQAAAVRQIGRAHV